MGVGKLLFEVCGVANDYAVNAFKTGSAKLPIKTQIVL